MLQVALLYHNIVRDNCIWGNLSWVIKARWCLFRSQLDIDSKLSNKGPVVCPFRSQLYIAKRVTLNVNKTGVKINRTKKWRKYKWICRTKQYDLYLKSCKSSLKLFFCRPRVGNKTHLSDETCYSKPSGESILSITPF